MLGSPLGEPGVKGDTVEITKEIRVEFTGTLERREDYWVATIPALGPFAYGDTAEEAKSRTLQIADMMLARWNEHGVMLRRLRDAGVTVTTEDQADISEWSADHRVSLTPA